MPFFFRHFFSSVPGDAGFAFQWVVFSPKILHGMVYKSKLQNCERRYCERTYLYLM